MPLPKSAACPSFSHEFEKEDKPMAKPYKIPDFRKLYPKASEEVIAVLRTTERKMQYQEYDLCNGVERMAKKRVWKKY